MVFFSFRQNDRTSVNLFSAAPDGKGNGNLRSDLADIQLCATSHEQRGAGLEEITQVLRVRYILRGSNFIRLGSAVICHVANDESQNRNY